MYLSSKLKVVKRIEEINLSAEDWQLYTSNDDAEKVADELNREFVKLVNLGKDKRSVSRMMHAKMNFYSDTGAADSEPYEVLDELISYVYGG